MLRDTALPLNPASLQPGGLRYSLGSANQSNRIKGDNSGGERSLQRQLGMGPKRIYLLSLSPEREKILPVALGSPCLRHKASGGNLRCCRSE